MNGRARLTRSLRARPGGKRCTAATRLADARFVARFFTRFFTLFFTLFFAFFFTFFVAPSSGPESSNKAMKLARLLVACAALVGAMAIDSGQPRAAPVAERVAPALSLPVHPVALAADDELALAPAHETVDDAGGASLEYETYVHPQVDASAPLPMVIALHGRGGSPTWFKRHIKELPLPVRWIIPKAPQPFERGYTWLSRAPHRSHRAIVVDELTRASDQLAGMIPTLTREHPTRGRPIVVGFSQGAMLAWSLAVHHADEIELAVPIAGFLPAPMRRPSARARKARQPRVIALHGRGDRRIALGAAKSTVKGVSRLGVPAELRVYKNAGHQITPRMRGELHRILNDALATSKGA